MSLQDKLRRVATMAAQEATTNERGRALWCIDEVLRELKGKLSKKLLSTAQVHAAEVKFKIAEAVCMELRRAIVSGARPLSGNADETRAVTGQPGTAGLISDGEG